MAETRVTHEGKYRTCGSEDDVHFVIRVPHHRILRVIARSVFLATAVLAFPWVGSMIRSYSAASNDFVKSSIFPMNQMLYISTILEDLREIGQLKMGAKLLFITGTGDSETLHQLGLEEDDIHIIPQQNGILLPEHTFDFIYASGLHEVPLINRALKVGGVAAVPLTSDAAAAFSPPPSFTVIYLRRFDTTVVALRKTTASGAGTAASTGRRLLNADPAFKKPALPVFEDALLEPPQTRSFNYLPPLIGDRLDEYPRRLFISVDSRTDGWFERRSPLMNWDFEMYKVKLVPVYEATGPSALSISSWLRRNVKGRVYVVMQAEAEVVEEMLKSRAISLVNELFLECNHQWTKGVKKTKRPYWQCLTMYGMLRDAGVAVHQWWD